MSRVAIVNDVAGVARLEVAALREAGWDADFLDLPKPGARWPRWAKAIAAPLRMLMALPVILRLRRGRYDLVHVHFVSQGFVGAASGRPYFLHAHGSDLHRNLASPLLRRWSRLWMRRARGIFYVTPNLLPYLTEFADKATLAPNPIDTDRFEAIAAPERLESVLIFMRLEAIKGPQAVFDVTAELAGQARTAAIDWGPMAGDLKVRYGDRVEFLAPVPHGGVPALLGRFDAVVGQMVQGVPGLSELEALASGRVVLMRLDSTLAGDDPPPVVNVADGRQLVEAIRTLRGKAAEVSRLSVAGRAWVERNHSLRAHAEVVIEAYQRLVEVAQPPAAR